MDQREALHAQRKDKGTLGLKTKPKRPPRTPKWSHQHDLDAGIGKHIMIELISLATERDGKLLAADPFAIKIATDENPQGEVYFKHDIGCFCFGE